MSVFYKGWVHVTRFNVITDIRTVLEHWRSLRSRFPDFWVAYVLNGRPRRLLRNLENVTSVTSPCTRHVSRAGILADWRWCHSDCPSSTLFIAAHLSPAAAACPRNSYFNVCKKTIGRIVTGANDPPRKRAIRSYQARAETLWHPISVNKIVFRKMMFIMSGSGSRFLLRLRIPLHIQFHQKATMVCHRMRELRCDVCCGTMCRMCDVLQFSANSLITSIELVALYSRRNRWQSFLARFCKTRLGHSGVTRANIYPRQTSPPLKMACGEINFKCIFTSINTNRHIFNRGSYLGLPHNKVMFN